MSASVKIHPKHKQIRKDGKYPISLQITIDSKRKYFPTELYTFPEHFDTDKNIFTGPRGQTERLNALLRKKVTEVDQAIMYFQERSITISFESLTERLKGGEITHFLIYYKNKLWAERKNIAHKTYLQYDYVLGVLEKYKPTILCSQIDVKFLHQLKAYLQLKNYKPNTIKRILGAVRKFVKLAIRDGLMADNPFEDFSVGSPEHVEVQFLTGEELQRLNSLCRGSCLTNHLNPKHKNTLVHFLHSCYTGLRAVDQRKFNPDVHIKEGFLVMEMQKTSKMLRLPLNDQAKKLHPLLTHKLKQSHSRIGTDLSELMAMAGITKHITFHCARHTFAINSLIKGVPLEVVSKWLGHSSISTTQIYAKVVDSLSESEMKKWNNVEEDFLKISISESGGIYRAKVLVDGKPLDLPVEQKNKQLLKQQLLKKLADWFS